MRASTHRDGETENKGIAEMGAGIACEPGTMQGLV